MNQWFVVQTNSNQEQLAHKKIIDAGFNSYLPMYTEIAFDKRKNPLERLRCLFPSYVFTAFTDKRSIADIKYLPGVLGLVGSTENSLSLLPDNWVEELRDKVSAGLYNEALQTMNKYLPGDIVEVKEGSFKGMRGEVLYQKKERITLLMTLLNGKNSISLSCSSLIKV